MQRALGIALLALTLPAPVLPVYAADVAAQATVSGLELVEKDRRGVVYVNPDVNWSGYTKIRLDPATVAFRKNWQRDQNRTDPFKVREQDMERIRKTLAELFNEAFTKELEQAGFEITTENGDDVMRITPQIVDLDVYAPDTNSAGRSYSYAESAGRMTLNLGIYDSGTGELLALASEHREAPRYGYMRRWTRVSNKAEAQRLLEQWAKALAKRLNEARDETGDK